MSLKAMNLEANIIQDYGNGCVQLETKIPKRRAARYFDIPANNVKSFASEMNQQEKKYNKYQNIALFTSIFIGCFGASFFTKKMQSAFKQFLTQFLCGVSLATAASIGVNEYYKKEDKELLQKYRAKELNYVI